MQRALSAPASDGGKARIPALKYKIGDEELTAGDNTEKARILAKNFFPPKPPINTVPDDYHYPPACTKAEPITKEQIVHQAHKLKPYKAPGPDGIPNVVITKCVDLLAERLLHIFKAMLERNLHYKPWKTFHTVVLRKPGKPRYDLPKAYRPVALLNTLWKLLAAIIAGQITYHSEKYQLLPGHHYGGRPSRSTTDAIHFLTHRIKGDWRKGNVTAVLFLDIEGAFPNAVPERLIHNLRKRQIPKRYTKFIAEMLKGRVTQLKFDDHTSDGICIDNGIGQGDPLSMILYQFYNADLLDIPSSKDQLAIAYVDDALILATAKDFTQTHQLISNMMTKPDGILDWSTTHNSPLELTKLALINFAHSCNHKERLDLILSNITIKPAISTKYLGVIIDQHLNWKAQHAKVVEKGTNWAMQIRRASRPSWGITPRYARKLYISVAIPRILYGAEIWCRPPPRENQKAKGKGSAKIRRQIITIQRSGAIAITGALRTSPTDLLNVCSSLIPATLILENWCLKAAVRLATLPPEHPLFTPIRSSASRYIRRHRSPLHILFDHFQIKVKEMEKFPTKPRNPALYGILPFDISIPASKEVSIKVAKVAKDEIQVYSDGSGSDGKIGAAAVLIRKGKPNRSLHYQLGTDKEHTVHEAELLGILLAIHLIKTEPKSRTSCIIGVDNQAAIAAFGTDMKGPAQHIAREVLKQGIMLKKDRKSKNFTITIRWTAGHAGTVGNELADKEAKKAASGQTSDKKLLPSLLKRKLPINPSAVKQAFSSEIKKRWRNIWRNSTRGQHMIKVDKNSPSTYILHLISSNDLPRAASSLITQILTNHIPLNAYLYKIKKVDSARCPACGASHETIRHMLLKCPTYAFERWPLEQRLKKKRKELSLENILGDSEFIKPLINFLEATHRFSPTQNPENNQTSEIHEHASG